MALYRAKCATMKTNIALKLFHFISKVLSSAQQQLELSSSTQGALDPPFRVSYVALAPLNFISFSSSKIVNILLTDNWIDIQFRRERKSIDRWSLLQFITMLVYFEHKRKRERFSVHLFAIICHDKMTRTKRRKLRVGKRKINLISLRISSFYCSFEIEWIPDKKWIIYDRSCKIPNENERENEN